ncbi:MAG TPA: hypothetical protein VK166_17805 [Chitinophagaceae bacterium]|nr:hypothetical protein [Chitinophagaceae bacterium]
MKRNLLILGLLISLTLQAQKTGVKLYGYSQGISKGIRKTTVNENGETKTEKKSHSKSFLIYLEIPSGMKLDITELWINGEKYRFKISTEKTPVEMKTGLHMPGQKERVLISKTENTINQVLPLEKITTTEKTTRNIVQKKALVVFYTVDGRSGYRSLEKLEELPDVVHE